MGDTRGSPNEQLVRSARCWSSPARSSNAPASSARPEASSTGWFARPNRGRTRGQLTQGRVVYLDRNAGTCKIPMHNRVGPRASAHRVR